MKYMDYFIMYVVVMLGTISGFTINKSPVIQQLFIAKQEGISEEVYLDSEGHKTVGIGHKLPKNSGLNLGDPVAPEQITSWFLEDFKQAREVSKRLFKSFDSYHPNVQDVLVSMAFQLGPEGLAKFKKFRSAIEKGDLQTAKLEMRRSLWYKQTPSRVEHLIEHLPIKNKG